MAPTPASAPRPHLPQAILYGWLICGTLDLISAVLDAQGQLGVGPQRLLQGVAGALLGPAAFEYGWASATLGLGLHYSVAFTWTAVFYGLSRRYPALLRWPVMSGLIYGAVVFLVMFRVVIPLTIGLRSIYLTVPFNHAWPKLRATQFFIHLVCIGVPIALALRRWGNPKAWFLST
ncbi:MAG: hypothetical protein JSS11_02815 [Verrucomicrobia bacterium]|nr:hypothetical protein [Verrucomicrobiota bacterium]